MDFMVDGRGTRVASAIRFGGRVGGGKASPSLVADHRRFRFEHALESLENALILLDHERHTGVELSALERVRDDLAVVVRLLEGETP